MLQHILTIASSGGGISWPEAAAIGGVISAIVLAYVGIRKLGPEKDAIYISSAQGAAVIMEGLIGTLRTELERERERVAALEAEIIQLRQENRAFRMLQPENARGDDASA